MELKFGIFMENAFNIIRFFLKLKKKKKKKKSNVLVTTNFTTKVYKMMCQFLLKKMMRHFLTTIQKKRTLEICLLPCSCYTNHIHYNVNL